MEACGGSHHWARVLMEKGFQVKMMAPQFVKPYVKGNKNDANDAEAIGEAMSRPNMRFVTPKTVEQQDLQALIVSYKNSNPTVMLKPTKFVVWFLNMA